MNTQLSARHKFRATVPRLPVADITETFDFYVGKLGLRPLYRFDTEAGVGQGDIILRFCTGTPVQHDDLVIYVEIANPDELYAKYAAAGVEVRFEPQDMPWGSRDFGIKDPNGYSLALGDFRDDSRKKKPQSDMAAAISAMRAGDTAVLRQMIQADPGLVHSRAPVDYCEGREATLLHILMDYPHGNQPTNVVEVARLLIDAGAEVDSLDGDTCGSTPLQLLAGIEEALDHGVALTNLLLDCGASATTANSDHGMDAFTVALLDGQTDRAAAMYARGYPANFPWAGAGLGNMDLVKTFFDESDNVALPTGQRAAQLGEEGERQMNCAFLVASINGQTQVVEYLVDKGMDVDLQPPGSDFAGIGATALHWAARFGRLGTVATLIDRGANVAARDDVFQLTPGGWAAWFEQEEVVRLLSSREGETSQ